jgi:hypothetical protein
MPSDADLSSLQLATRARVAQYGVARGCSGALRRGGYRTLHTADEDIVFAREASGVEPVVVVAQRQTTSSIDILTSGLPDGDWVDVLSGRHVTIESSAKTSFPSSQLSVAYYVPAGSACASLAP